MEREKKGGAGEGGGGEDSDSKITASLAILCRSKERLQVIPVLEYCNKILAVYKITFVHRNMYHSINSVK